MADDDRRQEPIDWEQEWGGDFWEVRDQLPLTIPRALIEFARRLDISPAEGWLICCLCYWKGRDRAAVWPSLENLAAAAGRSEITVRRYLSSLQEKGLIKIVARYDDSGRQTSNLIDFRPLRKAINELGQKQLPVWAYHTRAREDINTERGEGIKSDRVPPVNSDGQTSSSKELETNENDSLSLAIHIADAHGNGKQDRKALTTSLSKHSATVLERVKEILDKRVAEGDIKNPSAYANRLAQVFAEAQQEAEAILVEERRQTFHTILSTAVFEHRDGWTAERLREALLKYWPAELDLIDKATELVAG